MPEAVKAAYLRDRSAYFCRLAAARRAAGNGAICAKLSEVADDLEAQAIALERKKATRLI